MSFGDLHKIFSIYIRGIKSLPAYNNKKETVFWEDFFMIKGVNHRVVEVSDTGSEYFEKIMFFVSPEYASLSESRIREKAGAIAKGTSAPPINRRRKRTLTEILGITFGCLCCIALGIVLGRIV